MFSIAIENNQFGHNALNSIQQIIQHEVTLIDTFSLKECNDIEA